MQLATQFKFLIIFVFLLIFGLPSLAFAACATPTANAGAINYFSADFTYKMCDGTNWRFLRVADGNLTSCSGNTGKVEYDTTIKAFKFCNGTNYRRISTDILPLVQKQASDVSWSENFGRGIRDIVSRNLLVVSSHMDDLTTTEGGGTAYSDNGSVYIFDMTDINNPTEISKFYPNDPEIDMRFASEIDILGNNNYVVVGAPRKDVDPDGGGPLGTLTDAGKAYIYNITNAASPAFVASFFPSDLAAGDRFGQSVAVSGNIAVITSPRDADDGTNSGSAYVFDLSNPSSPSQLAKIKPSDGSANSQFGSRHTIIHGNLAIISCEAKDVVGADSGVVYIFDISTPSAPVQRSRIDPSSPGNGERFGFSLAAKGNTLYVSEPLDSTAGGQWGRVEVFNITNPASPTSVTSIYPTPLGGNTGDIWLGWSHMDIEGNYLAVASFIEDYPEEFNGGNLHVFDISTPTAPVFLTHLNAPSPAVQSKFGDTLRFYGSQALIAGEDIAESFYVAPMCNVPGQMQYDSTHGTIKFCDGFFYRAMAPTCGTTTIGSACPDGIKYAGLTPDGNVPMYVAQCDLGADISATSCFGPSTVTWNESATHTNYTTTSATSTTTGRANTNTITSVDADSFYGGTQRHTAAWACQNFDYHGYSDWFLPSEDELNVLYTNRTAIANFDTNGVSYWSSTEAATGTARSQNFSTGTKSSTAKNTYNYIRCVRRDY